MSRSDDTSVTNEGREALTRQYEAIYPSLNIEVHPDDEMYAYPIRFQGQSEAEALREYLSIGHTAFSTLQQVLTWLDRSWGDLSTMLDFASGYGRTTRFLATALPADRIWISDILAPAVGFQTRTFGVHGFVSEARPEDLKLPQSFDFISVVSLFSHLPDATFRPWLARLMAALNPSGIMVFTTHGPDYYREQFSKVMGEDFAFNPTSEIPSLDVESYGQSFCSRAYVDRMLRQIPDSTLLTHVPKGLNRHQDVYVVGTACDVPKTPCLIRNLPMVEIDVARYTGSRSIEIGGWALDGEEFQPIHKVDLFLDGIYAGSPSLGQQRPDLVKEFGRKESVKGGWSFAGYAPHKQGRARWVTASVEDAHGLKGLAVHAIQ